jgi:glycosyltransferase involved in cell wall biosynthesis
MTDKSHDIKIKYFSDYPYSIAFGGKEIQSNQYYSKLNGVFEISYLDYFDKAALDNVDIIHFFGHSAIFYSYANHLKLKYPKIKIVWSPTFYTTRFLAYYITAIIASKLPFQNIFRDLRGMSKLADAVIVNSYPERDQLALLFRADLAKTKVVFNAVEDLFAEEKLSEGSDLQPLFNGDYILSVGFFDERKNTIGLLKAFLRSGASKIGKLVLVGSPRFSNQDIASEFDKILNENPETIIDFGYLNRDSEALQSLYKYAKFHALVSFLETPGISNIEALFHGKNILVGDCSPVRSCFGDYATYCNPNSIQSITKNIDKCFSSDLAGGDAILDFALSKFSLNSVSDKISSIYRRVLIDG